MSTIAQAPTAAVPRVVTAPLNCSILMTDIVGFGDPRRDDNHRLQLRAGLLSALGGAFADAGVPWRRCRHQDRGDGLLTVAPPTISTTPLVDPFLPRLAERLGRHNEVADDPVRIRLRCALHVGPVLADGTGYPSASIIHAARMLDSMPLRRALAGSGADLAVMVSDYVYEAVVRHLGGPARPETFRPARYRAKGTPITSWLYVAAGSGDPEAET
jgi:class 3 adenylate cyclase